MSGIVLSYIVRMSSGLTAIEVFLRISADSSSKNLFDFLSSSGSALNAACFSSRMETSLLMFFDSADIMLRFVL